MLTTSNTIEKKLFVRSNYYLNVNETNGHKMVYEILLGHSEDYNTFIKFLEFKILTQSNL